MFFYEICFVIINAKIAQELPEETEEEPGLEEGGRRFFAHRDSVFPKQGNGRVILFIYNRPAFALWKVLEAPAIVSTEGSQVRHGRGIDS